EHDGEKARDVEASKRVSLKGGTRSLGEITRGLQLIYGDQLSWSSNVSFSVVYENGTVQIVGAVSRSLWKIDEAISGSSPPLTCTPLASRYKVCLDREFESLGASVREKRRGDVIHESAERGRVHLGQARSQRRARAVAPHEFLAGGKGKHFRSMMDGDVFE